MPSTPATAASSRTRRSSASRSRVDGLVAVTSLDLPDVAARLDRLVRSDLLRREVDPRSPERGQYAFVQALIREVAYATLALRDRRTRHLAAARHFESIGDEELAGALAAHYLAAFRASSEGPEAEALANQARIALRAAADRAAALGSPGQAMTFLEQAIEVAPDPAERAELFERAGLAAMSAAKAEVAMASFISARALRVELGDRSGQARLVARQANALVSLRRRDEARSLVESAWAEFADLGDDDADLVLLARTLASMWQQARDYVRATEMADRALGAAERLGLADQAAESLSILGTTAFYRGRLWEARALLAGAKQVAEEAGLPDVELRDHDGAAVGDRPRRPACLARHGARRDRARATARPPERRAQHPVQRVGGRAPHR